MDFARPLIREKSVVSTSNIRYIPPPAVDGEDEESSRPADQDDNKTSTHQEDDELDRQVIQAANRAAANLFGVDDERHVDSTRYPDFLLPQHTYIQAGDLVVLQLSFDQLDFVYVTPGKVFHNRNGKFPHDQFIGLPFGSKVRSADRRGYGYLYLLKPTPELWVRSLNHRTQIIHELDSSQIVFQLYLRPNMVVVETGTGSTALSHAIVRSIAPHGHLHTYEFNQMRAETARTDFERNGVSHLVTVHHGDSCVDGFVSLADRSVDAVSLDLPEPWRAVPHAERVLKRQARIASYSPCVEQTQRTVAALEEYGFHSIVTLEYRLQEHYVDQVEYEPPPTTKRPKHIRDMTSEKRASQGGEKDEGESGSSGGGGDGEDEDDSPSATDVDDTEHANIKSESAQQEKLVVEDTGGGGGGPNIRHTSKRRMVVARPFVTMRGHTAFLTFATLGSRKKTAMTLQPKF